MKTKKLKKKLQKFVAYYNAQKDEYEHLIKVEVDEDGLVYTKIKSFKLFIYPNLDMDKAYYFDVVYNPDKFELEIFNITTSNHIMADYNYMAFDSITTDGYNLSKILECLKAVYPKHEQFKYF